MKIKLLTSLAIAAAATASSFAHAADGMITITGSLTAQTCTINGGTKNFTVALPKVSASSLATAGNTAGRTPFTIALTSCSPTTGTVHTYFEAGPTTDTASGRLIVDAGGASNVQISLLNGADQSAIKAGSPNATQNSKPVGINSGAATLQYYAEYYATGKATAGAANTRVMYTLAYL